MLSKVEASIHSAKASTERFDRPERLTAEGLSRMSNPEPSRRIDTFDELSINLFEPEPILSESYDRRPQSRRPERSRRINLINIGTGTDITVKELAEKIKAVIGFQGEIKWDTSKPDGALKKLLDVSHLYLLGWLPKVKLEDGLKMTYNWFIEHCNK